MTNIISVTCHERRATCGAQRPFNLNVIGRNKKTIGRNLFPNVELQTVHICTFTKLVGVEAEKLVNKPFHLKSL